MHRFLVLFISIIWLGCSNASQDCKQHALIPATKPGVEVLFEKQLDLLKGKRIALITNPTGVNSKLESIIDLFKANPETKLVALLGPEHGIRSNAQAGEYVPYYFDQDFQLPVYSLYGSEQKKSQNKGSLDETMRSFDTQSTDKTLNPKILKDVDVIVFDLQDVGTRIYTYIATLAYALQACGKADIPIIVLDRPNPLGGLVMDGPILEYPQYSSFIGLYPIPLQHGMTIGELALLFNEQFISPKAKLTVVAMENWHRDLWMDETGLPWVLPSPNLPTLNSVLVYPGQVLLEGTNLSEGRGTTLPFEIFGAPWINGYELTKKLNAQKLPGVRFREIWFTPSFSKFKGESCRGSQLYVTDRKAFKPIFTTLTILSLIKEGYGNKLEFHQHYFDHVMGTAKVREALEHKETIKDLSLSWRPGLKQFAILRKKFLLY